MVHVKGLLSKQNIQPRILSLILFNHSKSNVLHSEIKKLNYLKRLEKPGIGLSSQ
jgi:hypothetical protein